MCLPVNQHGVVHRLDQALKQLLAVVQARAALLEILQQFIDRGTQLPERAGLPSSPMRPAAPASRVSCETCSEKSPTARSWRRFQTKSTPTPTAKKAEVKNQKDDGRTKSNLTSMTTHSNDA